MLICNLLFWESHRFLLLDPGRAAPFGGGTTLLLLLMHGLVELLDYVDDQYYFVLSCVRAP